MNRLRELRQGKGFTDSGKRLTQEALANELNSRFFKKGNDEKEKFSKMNISNWENEKHSIKPEKAQQLAEYFGVSVGYLLGYSEFRELKDSLLKNTFKKMGDIQEYSNEVFKNGVSHFIGEEKVDKFLSYINQQYLKENSKSPVPAEIITRHRDSLLSALDFAPDTIQEFFYLWGVLSDSERSNILELIKSLVNIKDTPDK